MWSSDRRLFLISLAALAGCGFTPVYGPGGSAQGLRGTIRVKAPDTRTEFDLVARLEQRLGRAGAAAYDLSWTLSVSETAVGITPDQETTRYHVLGELRFSLASIATGVVVTSGRIENFTSYAATGSTVSTLAANDDAYRRLAVILADQLVARLQATAADWR